MSELGSTRVVKIHTYAIYIIINMAYLRMYLCLFHYNGAVVV